MTQSEAPSPPIPIVVTDDEPGLRGMIADYLSMAGFAVRTAADAADLDRRLAEGPARVIVLDLNMPGEGGLAAARRLRLRGERAGIIMLTAQGDEESRVAGLVGGADDYMAKPFALSELLARIHAVLRRLPEPRSPAPLRFGAARIEPGTRRLTGSDGRVSDLSEADFQLLSAFLRHPRQVLSRERLSEIAHGRPLAPGERSLDIRVARLRKRVEADPGRPATIRTLHGEGYVFEPD